MRSTDPPGQHVSIDTNGKQQRQQQKESICLKNDIAPRTTGLIAKNETNCAIEE